MKVLLKKIAVEKSLGDPFGSENITKVAVNVQEIFEAEVCR